MKEQLISFETAVLAKKNNVEIESYEFYTHRGDLCKDQNFRNQSQYYGSYGAYKQTLLQEWFEKVHGKTIIIDLDSFLFNGKCDFKFYILYETQKTLYEMIFKLFMNQVIPNRK